LRFTESDGWTSAGALPGFPHVAVNTDGKATAVWSDQTTVREQTQDIPTGAVESVVQVHAGSDYDNQIVASLDRIAVFGFRPGGSGREISVTWRNSVSAWDDREPIVTAAEIRQWRVESDEHGNIVLLWTQADQIWSRIYEREREAWTRAQLITAATAEGGFMDPQISAGNVAVAMYWNRVLYGAYYQAGVGWNQASITDLDGLGEFEWFSGDFAVQTVIDQRGNVLAVGPTGYRRFLPSIGWQSIVQHGLQLGRWRLWMAASPDGSIVAITHDLTANDELIPQLVRFE
jgi:hypothetical protein